MTNLNKQIVVLKTLNEHTSLEKKAVEDKVEEQGEVVKELEIWKKYQNETLEKKT